ncbi:MAG TPA: hypothetical protein VFO85_20120, partial [Vicinamibacteria bacterium]|nr:hypothetical protein [Vicinamibacteria bacterium]
MRALLRAVLAALLVLASAAHGAAEQIVALRDGRRITVTRIERRGTVVAFVTTEGVHYVVAEDMVAAPPLASIPRADALKKPAPAPPAPARPAPARPAAPPRPVASPAPSPAPPPREAPPAPPEWSLGPAPWAGSVLFQSVPATRTWDTGLPGAPAPSAGRQGMLRGGSPVLGSDVFLSLSGVLDAAAELRAVPVASGLAAVDPGSAEYFGRGREVFALPRAALSAHAWRAGGPGRPRPWAVKATAVYAAHYLRTRESGVVSADPRR